MKRLAFRWLIASLVLLFAFGAWAKPSFKDRSRAHRLSNKAAFFAKIGKHEEAVEQLREADSLDPKPSLKRRLARSLIELDEFLEAMDVLEAAVQEKPRTWVEKQAVRKSKKLAEELEGRTPTLTIVMIVPKPAKVAADVTLDGESFDPDVGPFPVNPGNHEVVAGAEGYEEEAFEVELEEGAEETLKISLRKEPEPILEEEEDDGEGMGKWPAIVAWSIGGVGLAVGVGFGIVAIDQTNTLYDQYDCDDDRCPQEAEDDLDTSKMNGNISTVGFAVGGVGLVAGTILWLVADSGGDTDEDEPVDDEDFDEDEARGVQILPVVGAGYLGLTGTF
jgi:tetratricopeptide (TPR) repeat protein